MINRKLVWPMALVSATAIALAGCASSSSGDSSTKAATSSHGVYNWGVDAELSGELSYYGLSISGGVAAYVNSVNAKGGINGHKIKLTELDNAGDSSQSSAVATQLITADNVDAIFGQTLSSDCSAAQPTVVRYQVPMACFSVAQFSPYVFNLGYDDGLASGALIASAKKVTSKSQLTAAVLYPNTGTGIQLGNDIIKAAPGDGVKLVSSQEYDLTATNLSVQTAKIVAAKPDVVLISATGPGLLMVLKAARAAGLQAPFVWSDLTGNYGLVATSSYPGLYALNDYELIPGSGATGAAQDFITAMGSKLGSNPTAATINAGETVNGYITAMAFGKALKSCGYPCSGAQLTKAVEKVSISLPDLETSFGYTSADHYPYPNWYLYHIVGATTTLVGTFPSSKS